MTKKQVKESMNKIQVALMLICTVLFLSNLIVMVNTDSKPVETIDYTGLGVNIGTIEAKGISADNSTFYFDMASGDVVKVTQHDYLLWCTGDTYRYYDIEIVQGAET